MSRWTKSVSDAISIIDEVERCVVELGYHIDVELMPYKTSGGRGNGITATFSYYNRETTDNEHKYMSVSIWNHHNSDNICIKMTDYPPAVCFMGSINEDHDIPDLTFNNNESDKVTATIIAYLSEFCGFNFVGIFMPSGFGASSVYSAAKYNEAKKLASSVMDKEDL